MSRRAKRGARGEATGAKRDARTGSREQASTKSREGPAGRVSGRAWGLAVQIAFLAAVFGVVVLVAELAGAANLGVALGIGQIAFGIAVVYLLLRR